jgi:glycosyltransferase involved in cell wall biosynthesis
VNEMNVAVKDLVASLTPQKIVELSNKHGFEPTFEQPWKKNITAGSDDHSSLHLARTYTEVPDAQTWEEFWLGVEHNHAKVVYQPATPEMFARNAYGTGFQFYKSKFGLDRHVNTDTMLRFLNRALTTQPSPGNAWYTRLKRMLAHKFRGPGPISPRSSLMNMARREAEQLIRSHPRLALIMEQGTDNTADLDQVWAEFVSEVSNRILAHIGQHTIERLQHARVFDLFQSMGSSAALYSLITPYFVSYSLFAKERAWSAELSHHFGLRKETNGAHERTKVAHFTDTLDEVNGVAVTLQQEIEAAGRLEHDMSILMCSATSQPPRQRVYRFAPLASHSIPEYPELAIHVPPFLKILKHCYDQRYTHIHVATPGPMGLAGMAIARILHLPLTGTYHTAFPQYARALTEDLYVEQMMWTGMMWFYAQLDAVYVPSHATGADLAARGLSSEKIRVYPRGVDTVRFNPSKASRAVREELGVTGETPLLLYVGRVSKEKNLPVLVDAMQMLTARNLDLHLVIVGDGPYRKEMEQKLASTKATFTGYKSGEQLTHLFASADIFVLPSTTDTFGNVVLEAQASGLPVIVSNVGGPREMIDAGATGLVVSSMTGPAFAEAIAYLLGDPELRKAMGHAARAVTETRGIDACVSRLWEMYGEDEQRRGKGNVRPFPILSRDYPSFLQPVA